MLQSERALATSPAPVESLIRGKVYVLGDDVDTDQIIPAKYLMYNPADPAERHHFGRHALEAVPAAVAGLPNGNVSFVDQSEQTNTKSQFSIIVAGKNFGCGSSREHAPLALAEAGVTAVVAEFYARIFFRNAVNGGYLIPFETPSRLIDVLLTGNQVLIDVAAGRLTDEANGKSYPLNPLGEVAPIIEAGGVFNYARKSGLLA